MHITPMHVLSFFPSVGDDKFYLWYWASFKNHLTFCKRNHQSLIDLESRVKILRPFQSLNKEKQKAEARHINLRKRKALADLFKELEELGIVFSISFSFSLSLF